MHRFSLRLSQLSLNLPLTKCSLRFLIKHSHQGTKTVQDIPLQRHLSIIPLDEEIVFSLPDSSTNPSTVAVLVIAVTSQLMIYLGVFVVDLTIMDAYQEARITRCHGQRGRIVYTLSTVREMDSIHQAVRDSSESMELESSDEKYKSFRSRDEREVEMKTFERECKALLDENKALNERLNEAQHSSNQLAEQLFISKKENKEMTQRVKQLDRIAKELAHSFNQVETENTDLKEELQRNQNQDVDRKMLLEVSMHNRCVQTAQYAEEPALTQHEPQMSGEQVSQILDSMWKTQRSTNLYYLNKVNEMRLQQLEWELSFSNKRSRSYEQTLRKLCYPVFRVADLVDSSCSGGGLFIQKF